MQQTIKVYHYCYYATYSKNQYSPFAHIEHSSITKGCYLGIIDENKIKLPGWTFTLYYDDCPIKLNIDIDKEDNSIMIDYFTIDELNGYEDFIMRTLRILTSKLADEICTIKEI
jgi:hypothetical protein